MTFRSGEQIEISGSEYHAVVTTVGATLRQLRHRGRDLIATFGADELCPGSSGQVLAPWPNRLEDGSYRFGQIQAQAAIDDEAKHCAIHGLVRWLTWNVTSQEPDR